MESIAESETILPLVERLPEFSKNDCFLSDISYSAASLIAHLHHYHQTSPAEYLEDYPGEQILSEAVRSRMRWKEEKKLLAPHWEPLWSREYALDRLRWL